MLNMFGKSEGWERLHRVFKHNRLVDLFRGGKGTFRLY